MSWSTRTETKTETATETKVAAEDLDDVIELAARMMMEEEGALTETEVKEVAAELDIPPEYIERAREKLAQVKAEEKRAVAQAAQKKRVIIFSGAGVLVVLGIVVVGVNSSVASVHKSVESSAAQVENVKARQKAVIAQYQGRPRTPDIDAEITGAQNRVRVETKRYLDAATIYNQKASGFPASFTLIFSGLPSQVPLNVE